ncbi:ATP-binding protein [Cryptosporangium arvum]|uniref:Sensor-like histidine kinase SenX3 n=1 Tax=Cryptosporangium arvum DSM 44712 TaxID=927661 RepID=A0A010YN03_9ACTN|nr:ATP-binding protein [Cryptosporangium arvum]EXG81585.1 signal transduction histidine kinase [Cryptosporangium arvum DSM 44712]
MSPALGSVGFATLFGLAAVAGRLTILDGTNLSLVWPAAGVSIVWFVARRATVLDWALLVGVTLAVNLVTHAPPVLAAGFAVANVVQISVFLAVLGRLRPDWRRGGADPLTTLSDLWRMIAATVAGTFAGALIGPTLANWYAGSWNWLGEVVWLTRNVSSILAIGILGLLFLGGRTGERLSGWRHAELVALAACSAAAYALAFAQAHGLPLAFPLLLVTVWAGTRFPATLVALHGVTVGTAAVMFTLHGQGPFATVESYPGRALMAQAFVAMVAVLGTVLALGRDERRVLTGELAETAAASAAQAELLTTIVDSMSDALMVVGADGKILLRNPAALELWRGVGRRPEHVGASGEFEFGEPGGGPIPVSDLPHAHALAGVTVVDRDVVVRQRSTGTERVLQVSAAPLPAEDAGPRAVVVYHDVTVDRRHRDELTAFAGVVAHDLLNPLTTVEGWTEALADTLGDDPDARDCITRIRRGSTRMRHLINDLLGYTTARDGALTSARVPLAELVGEIASARIDQALAASALPPRFTVGALHDVEADPVLTRQLLENLLGNAIKYTARGVVPHVTVTTDLVDDRVRLTIGDNGIGIPPGQHEAIFADFHRAHRDAGYTGTGLGLAICARIVERHGGTIAASDNPGGAGSRFVLTLPAATTSAPARESAGVDSSGG